MRIRSPALIIAFANVTEALAVERYCQEHALPGRIIPVPREVTASCGLAWKAAPGDREALTNALSAAGLSCEGVYIINI